jgi:hypothetical protein
MINQINQIRPSIWFDLIDLSNIWQIGAGAAISAMEEEEEEEERGGESVLTVPLSADFIDVAAGLPYCLLLTQRYYYTNSEDIRTAQSYLG